MLKFNVLTIMIKSLLLKKKLTSPSPRPPLHEKSSSGSRVPARVPPTPSLRRPSRSPQFGGGPGRARRRPAPPRPRPRPAPTGFAAPFPALFLAGGARGRLGGAVARPGAAHPSWAGPLRGPETPGPVLGLGAGSPTPGSAARGRAGNPHPGL